MHEIDWCWRDGALERYALLQSVSPLSPGSFKREVEEAKAKQSDKRILRALKLVQHDPDKVTDAGKFQDLPRDWALHRMDVIDETAGKPHAVKVAQRKEARKSSLSNIAACYLVLRIEEGLRRHEPLLEITSAALAIPH